MIAINDPAIPQKFQSLRDRIAAQGVEQWLAEKADQPSRDSLVYLCKFGFFTGILTKAEIAEILGLDRAERKALIKSWYDDHREKGCGTC